MRTAGSVKFSQTFARIWFMMLELAMKLNIYCLDEMLHKASLPLLAIKSVEQN
jgi:hypothetical protein